MIAPDRLCPPQVLAFSINRHGNFTQALHRLGVLCQQLQQPIGARQTRRAATDDRDAHLDQLVLGVQAALDELLRESTGAGRPAGTTSVVADIAQLFSPSRPR